MKTTSGLHNITGIPQKELTSILKQGVILRLPYLESRLAQAQENIKIFEQKYHAKLAAFKNNGLPENAGYEMHEDFIEWEYWDDVVNENKNTVDRLKKFIEEAGEN